MTDKKKPGVTKGDLNTDPKDGFDLIEYPLDYQFKAMCRSPQVGSVKQLNQTLKDVVDQALGDGRVLGIKNNNSKTGKFVSVSIRVRLQSRDELERVYSTLADAPAVLMTL